jgi:raffinose/stachyose/melibiose transport system substrate-binding protein
MARPVPSGPQRLGAGLKMTSSAATRRPLGLAAVAAVCVLFAAAAVAAQASTGARAVARHLAPAASAVLPGVNPLPAGSFGAATTKKVTITLQGGGGGTNLQAQEYIIKAFEQKYPNITVKLLESGNSSASTQGTLITSGSAPDIVAVSPIASYYALLLAHHSLVNLNNLWSATSLAKRAASDVNNAFLGSGGTHYIVENQKVLYGMAYFNTQVFQKLGIPTPVDHRFASLQQFYSDVATLQKAGYQGLSIGGDSGYEEIWPVDAMFPTAATATQMANFLSSYEKSIKMQYSYTSGPFLKVIQTLHDFQARGVFQSGYLGANEAESQQPFLAGQAGMLMGGSWDAAGMRHEASFPYNWVLLPSLGTNPSQLTSGLDGDWGIPAQSKHIPEAELFLSFFLTNAMQAKGIVQIESNLPVVNLPAASITSLDPLVQEMLIDVKKNGAQPGWASTVPDVQAVIVSDLQSMWAGGKAPASIAQDAQNTVNTLRGG